jgi:hypothetical protein
MLGIIMKVITIDGIYEEGQVKLSRPAPSSHSKVIVNFIQDEKKSQIMNEEIFWQIMSLLDFSKYDSREVIRPCINRLMDFESEDIYQFEEILAKKLYGIDGKIFAQNISENPYQEGKYFSVDYFLYFRAGAISEGKDFYNELLKNPILFNEVKSFEPILYIAERAYKSRAGYEMAPATISYETYSNKSLWN